MGVVSEWSIVMVSQVFMLAASDVKDIIEEEPDVKEGLWRSCGIRIASHLLLEQQEYQVYVCICLCMCVCM